MNSRPLLIKAARVEYALVRKPLAVLDRTLSHRLPAGSPVRMTVHRGLETLDSTIGKLLRPSSSGVSPLSPVSDPAATTAPPVSSEPVETPGGEQTVNEVVDSSVLADEPVTTEELPADELEAVAEEILEQEQTVATGEIADASEDDQEALAELRAKHILEEQQDAKRLREQREQAK